MNLILYLNHGWKEDNEGWLELWDREMKSCVQRVLPIFNRMVVFSTSDFSYHGQPESIKGPPDLIRKSIALYYYSNGRPAEEVGTRDPRATLWQERPGVGYYEVLLRAFLYEPLNYQAHNFCSIRPFRI